MSPFCERCTPLIVIGRVGESGAIEQDADLIMLLYREDYYDKEDPQKQGNAEVIIGKQRNGPTGTVKLTFMNKTTRFENMSTQSDPF